MRVIWVIVLVACASRPPAREGSLDELREVVAEGETCAPRGTELVCGVERRSFGPLLDVRTRAGACYKACGPGCRGGCAPVQVGCVAPAGDEPITPAIPCFTYRTDAPDPPAVHDGRVLVVPRKHFRDAPTCANAVMAAGRRVVAVAGARLRVCTHAPCCATHDTCMRFDGGGAWARCQVKGYEECGGGALTGQPDEPWDLKWFDRRGWPVTTAGHCVWTGGAPRWVPPPVAPEETEAAACLVHGVKHDFDAWPDGGTPDAREIVLPTYVPDTTSPR